MLSPDLELVLLLRPQLFGLAGPCLVFPSQEDSGPALSSASWKAKLHWVEGRPAWEVEAKVSVSLC